MNTSREIALAIATGERVQDKINALVDGSVRIEGCRLSFVPLGRGEMLVRAFEDPSFNIAELSLSNYVARTARGDRPYIAIPVYIARSFRHADIYVRTDRGIATPADMRGKRIGIAEYEHTLYVWVRALLEDEHGVSPADVRWISVGHHSAGDSDHAFQPPPGVTLEHRRTASSLSEMLEAGEIDALISVLAPPCFTRGAPHVARLFADHCAAEDDYFRRTGIFPILHVMGMRSELVEHHPGLAQEVFRAFLDAKNIALAAEARTAALPAAAPALTANVERMTALMGEDYYPYGLNERDRRTLDYFLDAHFKQGLSDRRLSIAELFSPVLLSAYDS